MTLFELQEKLNNLHTEWGENLEDYELEDGFDIFNHIKNELGDRPEDRPETEKPNDRVKAGDLLQRRYSGRDPSEGAYAIALEDGRFTQYGNQVFLILEVDVGGSIPRLHLTGLDHWINLGHFNFSEILNFIKATYSLKEKNEEKNEISEIDILRSELTRKKAEISRLIENAKDIMISMYKSYELMQRLYEEERYRKPNGIFIDGDGDDER